MFPSVDKKGCRSDPWWPFFVLQTVQKKSNGSNLDYWQYEDTIISHGNPLSTNILQDLEIAGAFSAPVTILGSTSRDDLGADFVCSAKKKAGLLSH